MRNSILHAGIIIMTSFLLSSNLLAQSFQVAVFNRGNKQWFGDPIGGELRCNCGHAHYDCICSINRIDFVNSIRDINLLESQLALKIKRHKLKGNTLKIVLDNKIPFIMKSRFLLQKEEIQLNSELARELGCSNVVVLPAKYKIKCRKRLKLKVRLD